MTYIITYKFRCNSEMHLRTIYRIWVRLMLIMFYSYNIRTNIYLKFCKLFSATKKNV